MQELLAAPPHHPLMLVHWLMAGVAVFAGNVVDQVRTDWSPVTAGAVLAAARRRGSGAPGNFYRSEKLPLPGAIDNFGGPGPPYALLQVGPASRRSGPTKCIHAWLTYEAAGRTDQHANPRILPPGPDQRPAQACEGARPGGGERHGAPAWVVVVVGGGQPMNLVNEALKWHEHLCSMQHLLDGVMQRGRRQARGGRRAVGSPRLR